MQTANRYPGTVVAMQNNHWQIALAQPAGCGACHRGLCRDTDGPLVVEVPANRLPLAAGQKVWVAVSHQSGWWGIGLFYAVPSLLIIGLLAGALAAGLSEGVAAAAALLSLIPYYLLLAQTRKNWTHRISITVHAHE